MPMPDEGLCIDHVIYGFVDIDATAGRLLRDYGLGSVPGGRHLGGTTNRIVPLEPPSFLELLGVGDTTLPDGAWLAHTLSGHDRVLWWALGTHDIEESARRRGLEVQHGTMEMANGTSAHFRTAGMPRYPLPFFVAPDLDDDARLAVWRERYASAGHESAPAGYTFVEARESAEYLTAWLGDHGLPIRYSPDPGHGIARVGIQTARGEIVLE
jgi:hypothetical protein